ncbi:PREDICTED: T-cell immunomodulatory protein-like [Thamnophis sirtalis]|uniref:T-cell immunomodulatory protein-like n=1 Tax=Thamnophis sirtalis TaxID=35019 RepID=A0A6I9YEY7_9SAUR|nr:PREDICTED: T-cell immunomodulatory protein-like [Thamnophis sirtalis]
MSRQVHSCHVTLCSTENYAGCGLCTLKFSNILRRFADFDGDGQTEHLLPACADPACQKSVIYLSKPGLDEWFPVLQNFSDGVNVWGFVPHSNDPTADEISFPITLHIGDYNMDGYPDALAILKNTSGRYSIASTGILDIIVLSKNSPKKELAIHALKNNFEADAYFVKVIVLSGLCSNDCPRKITPFGVNQPGPYIKYTTVDANGYLKNGSEVCNFGAGPSKKKATFPRGSPNEPIFDCHK